MQGCYVLLKQPIVNTVVAAPYKYLKKMRLYVLCQAHLHADILVLRTCVHMYGTLSRTVALAGSHM
jgi:hypothetical protein